MSNSSASRRGIAVAMLVAAAQPALGDEPLYVKNLSPMAGLLGLPSQRDAFATAAGGVYAALHGSVASHYIDDNNAGEFVHLDGETLRFALDLRYGLAQDWDLQLELPWLQHDGGELDKLIDDWHDFWGLSDGGRSAVPRDLLEYRYATPAGGFGLDEEASGIGDVTLSLNHVFYRAEDAAAAVSLGYKFATGDEDDFTGSGADDVFVALRLSGAQRSDLPLTWHGQVGYLRAGDSDLLENFQRRDLWFAGIAMDWRFAQRWSALVQVDSHRGPLKGDLTATSDEAFLLTVGARWRISSRWQLDLSVIEDIQVESAPDVTFQAGLRFLPEV